MNNAGILVLVLAMIPVTRGLQAQTQKDTLFAFRTAEEVTVDGSAEEECWKKADWHPIDQVWIPYGAPVSTADFKGRFKVSWDTSHLYVLAEIVDDMLSDDHPIPEQNWWDDDCVELFIDENRSGGNHERSNNAFAYHISLTYDAIDLDASGKGINYRNHLDVFRDTVGPDTYVWEIALKVYHSGYSPSDPEASRVALAPGKLMGFTLAYCDNDKGTTRENFIGSMVMTQKTANDNYITADYFGPLLLVGANPSSVAGHALNLPEKEFSVFPNPVKGRLTLRRAVAGTARAWAEIRSLTGALLKSYRIDGAFLVIDTSGLPPGVAVLTIRSASACQTERLLLQ